MQSRLVCLSVVLIVLATVGGASAGILESAGEALTCPQNLVVANKVDNKEYMEKQIACILGPDSGCDEVKLDCVKLYLNMWRKRLGLLNMYITRASPQVGLKAKRIGPLVLSDHCPRPMCDECTKKVMVSFIHSYQM